MSAARAALAGLLLIAAPALQAPPTTGPVWAKPDLFWYRKTVPGGHLWLKVDAEHGVREPLFDHQRLAIELSLRTGTDYTPLTLPFADPAAEFVVKYDGSNAYIQEGAMAVEFVLDGSVWRCDLQIKWDWNRVPPTDYECLSRRPAPLRSPPSPAREATPLPRVSPDGRWEAHVETDNVVIRRAGEAGATLVRLSTDGSAADAYHAGSIRWSADSLAVTASRVAAQVWESDALGGTVKSQIVTRTWPVPRDDTPGR